MDKEGGVRTPIRWAVVLVTVPWCLWACGDAVPSETVPSDTPVDTARDASAEPEEVLDTVRPSGLAGVLVTVHCDPHDPPTASDMTHWTELQQLVAKASDNGVKLNILLSYPWLEIINVTASMQSELATWVLQGGHQIGWHHHDVTHAAQAKPSYDNCGVAKEDWNNAWRRGQLQGWEQLCAPVFDPDIGFSAMLVLRDTLQSLGVADTATAGVHVGCHGTQAEMRDLEWKAELRFSQSSAVGDAAATVSNAGSLARLMCRNYAGQAIAEFGSNPFVTVKPSGPNAESVASDLTVQAPDHVASVSFHPSEYTGAGKAEIDRLFEVIASNYGPNELASEVLQALNCR